MDLLDSVLEFLWKNSRFASYFYQSVRFCRDNSVATLVLSVQAKRAVLYFNPVFFAAHSRDELVGLLIHELLHLVFNHRHRAIRHEHPFLQNLAQDMVINTYIHDRKNRFFSMIRHTRDKGPELVLPQGLPVIPSEFFGDTGLLDPSWEAVYTWLKTRGPKELQAFDAGLKTLFTRDHSPRPDGDTALQPPGKNPLSDEDESDRGDQNLFVLKNRNQQPLPTGAHDLDATESRRVLDQNLSKALSMAGRDDAALNDRLFKDISAIIAGPRVVDIGPLVRKIKTLTHRFSPSPEWQPSYTTFNRRFFAKGLYAPGRRYLNLKTVTVAVDVSASMVTRPRTLEKAFGAVEALIKTHRVNLVCLDEALFVPVKKQDRFVPTGSAHAVCVYKKGDWRYIRSGNSGTTFFVPLFNRYMSHRRDMLIVITDGQIYDLAQLRPYARTIWLVPEQTGQPFDPPFGTVLYLEERT